MHNTARLKILADHASESLPQRGNYTESARQERLDFLRNQTQAPLTNLSTTRLNAEGLHGNIESFIGSVEIPVGAAGPLLIHGSDGSARVYAPFATTEGALVASAIRGAKAITLSGGVTVRALQQRMSRAPIFEFQNLIEALAFKSWIETQFTAIQEYCRNYSNFAELVDMELRVLGKSVHVIFQYVTGDAAGQNMTTHCTWNTCLWLITEAEKYKITVSEFYLEGNLSSDKKASLGSVLRGRGTLVVAECLIRRDVMMQVLKVEPRQLKALYDRGQSATIYSGLTGFNINLANVVAAIFAATGQDIACVHESSQGQVHLEMQGEDLYVSLTMPNLIVGTIGGGVGLPTQSDLLDVMGCRGKGKATKLAEIIAGFALALDISTMSAIAGGQFATAHKTLGRRDGQNWLKKAELDGPFFTQCLENHEGEGIKVEHVAPLLTVKMGDSLLLDLASKMTRRLCGLKPYSVRWRAPHSTVVEETRLLIKLKALDTEVLDALEMLAAPLGKNIAALFRRFAHLSPFAGCHVRELEICKLEDEAFTSIAPKVHFVMQDHEREVFVIVEELLENMVLFNSVDGESRWQAAHVTTALEGIAGFHGLFYGKVDQTNAPAWIGSVPDSASLTAMKDLWYALAQHAHDEFGEWFTAVDLTFQLDVIDRAAHWAGPLDEMKKCVIHNDFNPRNLAFRELAGGELRLCAYDWELATVNVPQHDLAELLCFTLSTETDRSEVDHFIEFHRASLEKATQQSIDKTAWRQGYQACLYDYLIQRAPMYIVAHTHKHSLFVERVYRTLRHLISLEESAP